MAEATIQLRRLPSGEVQIVVRLAPDDDWLPAEHERVHRGLIERLVETGVFDRPDGRIVVERERPACEPALG